MSVENDKDKDYKSYIQQKHSGFGVETRTLEDAMQEGLGLSVLGFNRIIAGENNEVYDIATPDGNYVLRISRSSRTRFLTEKWALDEIQKKNIPAPRMLFIGEIEDKEEALKFCIESKVPGIAMSELLEAGQLTNKQIASINFEVGSTLAQIHSVIPRGFGKFAEPGIGKYTGWRDLVLKYSEHEREETIVLANKAGISREQIDLAIDILGNHEAVYSDVTPHLLHFDFAPKNILINVDGSVSSVIDFENCMSGDPMYDLAWSAYFDQDSQSLRDGYASVSSLPDDYVLRQKLYGLRIGLDLVRWFAIENHNIGMAHSRIKMEESISHFRG